MGKGSFGLVIRALDQISKKEVAIKIIKNRPAFYHQATSEIQLLEFIQKHDPLDEHFIGILF
jgi:hypothetical protein